jgi:MSHA biogenesis protein MshL
VPEGIIITVHPSVDLDTNQITMNLRPSITRVIRTVSDPGALIISGGDVENLVPELSVREMDSIVRMHSGATIIMGGLMQDRTDSVQQGVPVLDEAPIIGPLFRSQRDGIRKTEMVILLRAVVVDTPKPDQTDKELYKELSADRRPFSL